MLVYTCYSIPEEDRMPIKKPSAPAQKNVYTIAEVAELMQFSDQTIREWIRSGRLHAARPGIRAWRIPRSEVERLMRQFEVGENTESSQVYNTDTTEPPMP